jgi:hypothetical protein
MSVPALGALAALTADQVAPWYVSLPLGVVFVAVFGWGGYWAFRLGSQMLAKPYRPPRI